MKRKTWIHTLLHLGCIAVLLVQGYRIQQAQKTATFMQWRLERLVSLKEEAKASLTRWQIFAITRGECSDPRCIATAKKVVCREIAEK
jgi:hypothetical protein